MHKFRSVCGYEAEIQESSSERTTRLTTPGQKLYQARLGYGSIPKVEVHEYEVIASHKREVYLYPTAGDKVGTYPGKLVGWKSICFNDNVECWFEHPEDAINMFVQNLERKHELSIKAARGKLCEIQQQTQSDKPSE